MKFNQNPKKTGYYNWRWRPNAQQRREYAKRMREAEASFVFFQSDHPIRNGCKVKWVDKSSNDVYEGEVVNNSYGSNTNQHTFTILLESNGDPNITKSKKLVKGRNLYDRLLVHIPGKESKKQNEMDI